MNAVASNLAQTRAARRTAKARPLFRSAVSHVVAHLQDITPGAAARNLYPGDDVLRTFMDAQKAAVDPAVTTVPEWAGNLVRETWDEFVESLPPHSVFAQLSAMGVRLNFDGGGKVNLPARDGTNNVAGDFIGENAPIPVKRVDVSSVPLTPKKLAVLTAASSELSTATGGRFETFLRDAITEDTAKLLDTRLLDANAATDVRPAGLLYGVTPIASAGATLADIATDAKALAAAVLASGEVRHLVWLMNPLQFMSLAFQTCATGASVFGDVRHAWYSTDVIVSPNVPVGTLILVDAAYFASVADDAPQFRVSAEGVLHMEDTAPDPINGGTMASPVVNLFQQDAIAIRMVQQMNWTMRRSGMVAAITDVQW